VLERPIDIHNKVEIQTNSKFQSLTSSPTQSPGPPCIQIDTQGKYDLRFGRSKYAWKDKEIKFQPRWSQGQLKSESPTVIKTSSISITFLLLHHLFWADGPCIELDNIRDVA
jgi:hypothetical protein